MKKTIFKQLSLLCLLIVLTAIYKPVKAQQNPPEDSVGMGWIYELYQSGGNFLDIKNRAERFFATHPEYDTVAEFKNQYLNWYRYWQNRAHWVDSAAYPGDMGSAQKAMSQIYSQTLISNSGLPYQPSWKLKSPDSCPTQNMGIITCTWVNPNPLLNGRHILAGTEASGLWETTDGGLNWENKTDTYLQSLQSTISSDSIPIGFGVSSISVIFTNPDNYNSQKIILISTYVPGTNLGLGHGLGILASCNTGNTTWKKLFLPSTTYENIHGLENMNWKVIDQPENPSNINLNVIYASYGEYVYRLNFNNSINFLTCIKVFDLHQAIDSHNFHVLDSSLPYITQKVRDMEIIYDDDIRTLFISTDGFFTTNKVKANAHIFYAQLDDLNNISAYTNNASWRCINIDTNKFIDYIAIDSYERDLFAAYDITTINTNLSLSDNETFYLDKFSIDTNMVWLKPSGWACLKTHTNNFNVNSLLAGFGYRYNGFEIINSEKALIGGFKVNLIDKYNTPGFNFTLHNALLINSNNENFAKNQQYHYGIRSIDNSNGFITMGTEGGITKIEIGDLTLNFTNINGKGLAIGQVSSMTTTHNSKYDIIVSNSFRNGLWRFKCNTWDNFYWEDGGNLLLDEIDRDNNDNGEPDYVHNVTSNIFWMNGINPLHYCTLDDCLGPAGLYPANSNLTYQSNYSNFSEYNYDTPFEFSSSTNDTIYHGLHNIYQSDDFGVSWDSITSTYTNNYPRNDLWSGNLKVIKVAPGNPDVMYIAFGEPTWDFDTIGINNALVSPRHKIYKGIKTNNIWSWTDLTAGISNLSTSDTGYILRYSGITDIAINPYNSSEIWVTFNMFEGSSAINGKYRVLHYKNSIWSDYSNGLTSAPANCIIYNKYSVNDELFVGTDAGVFYRNSTLNSWQLFHINNPKWIVTDLEINYNSMMLRAAMWGRGIWETPVKCTTISPVDHTINSNLPWNFPVINCGNITINAGATLTINANVEMAQNAKITVKRGGKLVINNATINSYCQQMWSGIIVDGDYTKDQTNLQYHGSLELRSCTIEDAIIGVRCIDLNSQVIGSSPFSGVHKGGGNVFVLNTTFRNNYYSVILYPYAKMSNNFYFNNISKFSNCNFIIDQPLKRIDDTIIDLSHDENAAFVRLYGIKGLLIIGCKFLNENLVCSNSAPYLLKGIYATNSSFLLNTSCSSLGIPCPAVDIITPVFSKLKYGIYSIGSFNPTSPFNESFSVKNTIFNNNKYGLYAYKCDNFYMISNTFKVPYFYINTSDEPNPHKPFYGAYLDHCVKDYHVEGNTFGEDNSIGFIGLYVNNSNDDYKCIYNNSFYYLAYNFIARGNNGPNDNVTELAGLKIKCNDFTPAMFNISIIGDSNQSGNGISYFQGRQYNPSNYLPSDPAGNRWLDCCSNHDIFNECSTVNYFHHSDGYTIPNIVTNATFQTNYGTNTGQTFLNNTNIVFNKSTACPAIDIGPIDPLPELPVLIEGLNIAQQQLNSARLIYRIWIDGGNTEALQQAVNLALPYEAYELYNNLISKSAYLSDAVLIDAISNEEVLPPLMLKMILLANPQAVKSQKVMDALYARVNPFPDAWIDELWQGGGSISPREQLESEINYMATQKQVAFNRIVSFYLSDTAYRYSADSLIALQQRENTLESDIDLMYYYISLNMTEEADHLRDQIPQRYIIPENKNQYWENTFDIIGILLNLKTNNQPFQNMLAGDREKLYQILNSPATKASGIARLLLMLGDTSFVYSEPVDLPPDIPQNKTTQPKKTDQKPIEKLEVYPNPANDFVTLTYQINESLSGLLLIICDAMGKTVYTQALSKPDDNLLIVLKNYAKGNYIASIINNKKTIKTCKFVVQ